MSTQLSHALARIKVLEDNLANTFAYIKEVRLEAHNAAVAAERERCAKVCDEMDESFVTIYGTDYTDFQNDPRYLQMAADAIRKDE